MSHSRNAVAVAPRKLGWWLGQTREDRNGEWNLLGLDHVSDVEESCSVADVVVACNSKDMSVRRRDMLDTYLRRRSHTTVAWKTQRREPSSRHYSHGSRRDLSAGAADV